MARCTYAEAVSALRAGDRVMVTLPDPTRATDVPRYHLVDGGGRVTKSAWQKLLPDLVPVRDGLFLDGLSQTYRWGR